MREDENRGTSGCKWCHQREEHAIGNIGLCEGEHHYTLDAAEKDALVAVGWSDEGVGWYSDTGKSVPLYREYNPNQRSCNHNYTTNKGEHDELVSLGWQDEGVGWYAVAVGD